MLFAVLLAFVFSGAFSQFDDAERAVDLECGALHAASMLISTLPPTQARDLLTLETQYLQNVAQSEWPALRANRHGTKAAALILMHLMQQTARLSPANAADTTVKSQLLSLLAEAHAQREVRLYQATNGLPAALWIVLIGFSLILMTFVASSGLQSFASLMLFSATFAVCVSATLVLVRLLDYPFEGALALSPQDFEATMRKVSDLLRSV